MKAAVMTAYRQPLESREVPDPRPGDDDAVIRVEACGVCRSDWHLWQQDWSWVGVTVPLPAGVGLATVQIARALGARVIAVSRTQQKLDLAKAEGAAEAVVAGENAAAAIRDISGGGAHLSVDALGSSATTVPAILSLRKGGRHLQQHGLSNDQLSRPAVDGGERRACTGASGGALGRCRRCQ